MRAGFDLGMEALDFVVEIVSNGIHSHVNCNIPPATESFSGPVRALIQTMQHFDEADRINLINAARFRIVADRWRIACNGEHIANSADGPGAEKRRLQADDVLV